MEGELAWIARHDERRAGRFLRRNDDTLSAAVFRQLLLQDLALDACSRELSIAPEQLRQRLAHEGANYRSLRRAALIERASPRLRDGESLDDVADALGYSDGRSFRRALKAATGLGVADLRRLDLASTATRGPVVDRLKLEKVLQA